MPIAGLRGPLLFVSSRGVRFLAAMASQATHYVFVYGTLKSGEPNHHVMEDTKNGKATLIGTAVTAKKWPLVIASAYNIPYLLHCEGKGHSISGELYSVDDKMLAMLDEFESHPKYYLRTEEDVELTRKSNDEETTKKLKAWIYFLKDYREELLKKPCIANYSSKGDHGLEYVPRYLRQAQDPKNLHRQEVLRNETIPSDKQ